MSARDRADALRQQAESLDEIATLEDAASSAKAAYQADKNDETKAAHREAGKALADAREELRQVAVVVAEGEGSTSVSPPAVTGKKG